MTYLQLVNGALRRLRENTVTTKDQTLYSTMVGEFVNDAKRLVESRWNWSANRQEIVVTTVLDQRTYSLTGFSQDGKVLTSFNDTENIPLEKVAQAWMDRKNNIEDNIPTGDIRFYTFRSVDASDDSVIEVYPNPTAGQELKFYVEAYQADLSADDDVLNIPALPVLHLTVAMLAEEKGEAGGTTSARYFRMADQFLADAIMADAEKNREEWVWKEV